MAAGGLRAAVWMRVLPAGRSPGPHARGCPSHSLSWGTTSVAPGARPCPRPVSARGLWVSCEARFDFAFPSRAFSILTTFAMDMTANQGVASAPPLCLATGGTWPSAVASAFLATSVCWDVKPLLGRLAGVADSLVPSTRPRGRRGRQNIISREPRTLAACWAGPCGTLSPPRRGRRYISRVLRSQRTGLRVRPVKSFPTPLKRLIGTKT